MGGHRSLLTICQSCASTPGNPALILARTLTLTALSVVVLVGPGCDPSLEYCDSDLDCETAQPCVGDHDIHSIRDPADIATCESVSGNLTIHWLSCIDLPCLRSVGGSLDIYDNVSSAGIHLPTLLSVGGHLEIYDNDSVIGNLGISDNTALTTIDMQDLTTVGFTSGGLTINHNDSLSSLDGFTSLAVVIDNLTVLHNACLSQAAVDAFAASVVVGGSVIAYGNHGPCP